MTTIADLVDTEPDPAFGVEAGFPVLAGGGTWRAVLELADPAAGSSVEWFDMTSYFTGYEYTRGSDSFLGRYRAGIVTLDLYATDDRLAPWNDDTTDTFGVNVSLGPGILLRFGFIRVDGGVVEEWNPRWTCKVQLWGDAAYSQGKIRRHRIIARDTLTALVNVPIPATLEENYTDRAAAILTEAEWEYGSTIYGPTTIGGVGIFPVPDRAAQSSAINELDATLDPAGAVWYTNRRGQLIVRPSVYDTWLASKFDPGGAAGTPYPTVDPTVFAWWACTGEEPPGDYGDLDTLDVAAYAMDTPGVDPFGLDRSELAVINHVVITSPSGTYDDDNPTSVQRYDRHTLQASWIAANDFVADDILAARATATLEARPLTTTILLDGFQLGPSYVDYLDPVDVWHRNGNGLEAHAEGWCRGYRERVRPLGCDTDWSITLTLDVFDSASRDVALLPVTDLTLTDVTDLTATFTWGNPTQVVTPTHTQVRMNGNPIWLDLPYPITGMLWGGLTPYTPYEFEVRLIRVVDGIITHFSPSRSVVFMTADPDVPIITPDPDDPTGVIVTPPAPDDPEDCYLEWELQESADGETGWTTIDDGTETVPPYTFAIDLTGLDDEMWYRVQTREVCGGIPGDWVISGLFPPICFPVSQLGVPPFDDADLVAYWPQVCPGVIAEAVSDEPMTFGPSFAGPGLDGAGLPTMTSSSEGVIGYGVSPVVVPGSTDLTIACRVNFGELPAGDVIVFAYGGLYISAEVSGGGYTIEGHALEAGVGTVTIGGGPTVLALDTDYVLTLAHDVDGDLSLYVDDDLEDTGATIGARTGTLGDLYQIGAPADSWVTDCAVWDVVLAPTVPWTPADGTMFAWWDFTDTATIAHTGGLVDSVQDKTVNNRDLVATSTARPTTGVGTLNGLNVLNFDGGDTLQANTAASVWNPLHNGTTDIAIAMVVRLGNVSNPDAIYALAITSNISTLAFGMSFYWDDRASTPANERLTHFVANGGSPEVVVNATANGFAPANTWCYLDCVYKPGHGSEESQIVRNNGTPDNATGTGTPVATNATHALTLGNRGSGGFGLVGAMAEVIVTTDPANDLPNWRAYVAAKYAL